MSLVASTESVSKSFGGVDAVADVTIEFRSSTLYGLIGPNGAGKSTLVNLISGETDADSGRVFLDGDDVTELEAYQRARRGLARTFQTTRLPSTMTVAETVLSGCLLHGEGSVTGYVAGLPTARRAQRQAGERVDEILQLTELDGVRRGLVTELTYADKRRLEIARALSLRPRVLLLDEPTAGMSIELLPPMAALMRRLVDSGITVVIIEHNVPFIRDTVDDLYAMDSGRLIGAGDPHDVLSSEAVIASYLGEQHDG